MFQLTIQVHSGRCWQSACPIEGPRLPAIPPRLLNWGSFFNRAYRACSGTDHCP